MNWFIVEKWTGERGANLTGPFETQDLAWDYLIKRVEEQHVYDHEDDPENSITLQDVRNEALAWEEPDLIDLEDVTYTIVEPMDPA